MNKDEMREKIAELVSGSNLVGVWSATDAILALLDPDLAEIGRLAVEAYKKGEDDAGLTGFLSAWAAYGVVNAATPALAICAAALLVTEGGR